jgi:hypothetical protein
VRIGQLVMGGVLLLLALAVGTYVAGELTEVASLRTFDADGGAHVTKLWVVDHAGSTWIRVARPGRAWFRRLSARPEVELARGGDFLPYTARPDPSPAAIAAIDAAFRAKYGWTDAWYGLLLRSHAIPVELKRRASFD